MTNLMVCRFCLATDNTLIVINNKVTAKNIVTVFGYSACEDDGLPQYLCAFCCYLVAKFASFRRRCDIAQTLFQNAALEGREVTASYIESLDRKSIGLCLPLTKQDVQIIDTQYLIMKLNNTNKEFSKPFDTKSEDRHLGIDHKETVFVMPVDEVDVLVSPYIKEETDTKEFIDFSIEIKNESIDDAETNIEKGTHENLNECHEDVELKVKNDNDNDKLPTLSIKEKDETNELIDAFNEYKKRRVAKAKTECRIHLIGLKERNETKQLIDTVKRVKKSSVGEKKTRRKYSQYRVQDFADVVILSRDEQLKEMQDRVNSKNYINSQLKCEKCYRGFGNGSAFQNHLIKHNVSSGNHVCDICTFHYRTERRLRYHILSTHKRKFACKQCSHVSNTFNDALQHHKHHNNVVYKCQYCDSTFRRSTTRVNHIRLNHASDYVCNYCGASFVGAKGLKAHKDMSHKGDEKTLSSEPKQNHCEVCNLEFKNTEALERHTSTSSKHNGDSVCSLSCVHCGEAFPTNRKLLAHCRHHDKKPAKCEKCGKQFSDTWKCYTHYRLVHTDLTFYCEICGKPFLSKAALKCHQSTHTSDRSYKCTVCDKSFKTYFVLKTHIQLHAEVKAYSCAHCSKEFLHKQSLKYHMKTHTGVKFECHLCNKNFTHPSNLKRHIKLHTGPKFYHCETCDKSYNAKRTLEDHIKHIHMGVPYPKRIRIRRKHNND